jgi:hypothetical protein
MWNIPAGGMLEDIQVGCFGTVVPYVIYDVICYDAKGEKN